MSKRRKYIDPRQKSLDFSKQIEAYQKSKEEILETINNKKPLRQIESPEEACIEIAAGIKRAIRKSNLSRDQIVDAINEYFGWAGSGKNKKLSIHMLNHHLSKPAEDPIPAYYLFAIMRITGSLDPIRPFADAEDARVISGCEVRELALGKLEDSITEMQRLKKELKGRA